MSLDPTEYVLIYAIAILYPFFFNKLANRITGYNDVDDMCNGNRGFLYKETPEDKKCREEKEKKLEQVELYKHLVLIAVALIGIILSSVIQTKATKLGVGFGSVLTLITAMFLYWYRYGETTRLVISGLSLLFVILFSVRLYKIDSMEKIFSFEFGTK